MDDLESYVGLLPIGSATVTDAIQKRRRRRREPVGFAAALPQPQRRRRRLPWGRHAR
jgi:hypothetical protein